MAYLSFKEINVNKFGIYLFVFYFLLLISYILETFNTVDEDEILLVVSSVSSLIAILPWYWFVMRLDESLKDETIEKRVKWIFIPVIFSQLLSCVSSIASVDWLEIVSGVAGLLGYSYYFSIGVRCIRKGDNNVKKFGNLLIYIGIIAGIFLLCLMIVLFIKYERGYILNLLGSLSAFCFVYPFIYMYKILKMIEINNTDEDLSTGSDISAQVQSEETSVISSDIQVSDQSDLDNLEQTVSLSDEIDTSEMVENGSHAEDIDDINESEISGSKRIIWIIVGIVILLGIAAVLVFKFLNQSDSPIMIEEEDPVEEFETEYVENDSEIRFETNLVDLILNKPYREIEGQKVYYFTGEFIYDDIHSPIMLAFCENPDNAGHICGIAYKNLSSDTVLDMDGMFAGTEITLTGYDGDKPLEIILHSINDGASKIFGEATYGFQNASVEISFTDNTFPLPESILMLGKKNVPEWTDSSVLATFDKTDLAIKPQEWMCDNLFRSMSVGLAETGRFEGKVNENSIIMEMKINFDGTVSGRYCYSDRSVARPGEEEDRNWNEFHGNVLFDSADKAYVLLEVELYDSQTKKEYILLGFQSFDKWSGKSFMLDKDSHNELTSLNDFVINPYNR